MEWMKEIITFTAVHGGLILGDTGERFSSFGSRIGHQTSSYSVISQMKNLNGCVGGSPTKPFKLTLALLKMIDSFGPAVLDTNRLCGDRSHGALVLMIKDTQTSVLCLIFDCEEGR